MICLKSIVNNTLYFSYLEGSETKLQEESKHNTYNTLIQWHNFRISIVAQAIIVGAISGLIVVLYRFTLEKLASLTSKIYEMQTKNILYIPMWLVVLVCIGLILGKMIKSEPMISGSGIPQVEGVLLKKLNMNWWKVIIGKFIGGSLALFAGLSLGREGPSVQLGAAVGQGFSRIFKRIKLEEKYLITSGASAGLAAAFNAPLAGVIFALEEIHKNFSPIVLTSAMAAAVTADFISKEFFGLSPVFKFDQISQIPLNYYIYVVILGIIIGCFGVLFNKALLKAQDLYKKQNWLSIEFRPLVPLMVAAVLGLFLPQVLGGGHELVISMVKENLTIKLILILLTMKFLFTMVSFGSGVPGGIFLPLLVIGALTGELYGNILVSFFNFNSQYINAIVILSMAGYFTAIVKAPITGAVLITEMTGSFNHLLSLSIVCIIAYMVADALHSKPIYEVLLQRILTQKSGNKLKEDSKVKMLIEIPVCIGSKLDGKEVRDYKWPQNCLLVSIRRGEKEIIPKGDAVINAGDCLIVLSNENNSADIRDKLAKDGENN